MKKFTFFKTSLACLSIGFSFYTYASCPKAEDIKQNADGTHYVPTQTGSWKQFINYQSFHGLNEGVKALSLYHLFGMKKNQSDENFQQVLCIYRLVDEDNKYIVLVSPKSNYKLPIIDNPIKKNEWKMLQPTKAVCIPDYSQATTQEINVNQCEFEEIY
ncbi:hypothetical protein QEJ31_10770 [Pigmentibacter sp. JX0631]|uniref:hypothetical protein n=1 Tax=Pigmentibacter sp. JX0631 TaxID=2976982 RepID=UPI0024693258|nr:hypothetical protein [Pigmentibacter sp. JX0631]WGL59002.1 hypothetical protein QEJ31_10770 [Pigmentibacter sp. JX0631]